MYRVRFHGRGGQGLKTASRVLGTALFHSGFEVQDAPRYGAERRGAPVFAYVRASREPIVERGIIAQPDLIVVADGSVIGLSSAETLAGADEHAVLLIASQQSADRWRSRLDCTARLLTLRSSAAADEGSGAPSPPIGIRCAGAAARLLGVVSAVALKRAIEDELSGIEPELLARNVSEALQSFADMAPHAACVSQRGGSAPAVARVGSTAADWIDLAAEPARLSAPAIHAAANSEQVQTGLWRTTRPSIDDQRCGRCWWVCSSFCPDGAISGCEVEQVMRPVIDYAHCKGCMICGAMCPWHAIEAIAESAIEERR